MIKVELTHRAMLDLNEINEYSIQKFGRKTAEKYLDDIEAVLCLIKEQPKLLVLKKDTSKFFQFYPIRNNYLICTRVKDIVIVLTIKHCQMDLRERLNELEPSLQQEAELLHKKLLGKS
jgi:plasmid stabilization system protein ParE